VIKKAKNTAILNDDIVIQKAQVLEIPDSDYINTNSLITGTVDLISKYKLKSITITKGRNTVVEIIKEA
jgi:hypothetical protein